MLDRQHIIDLARAWKETPWRHQGRSPQGIDCAGLIVVVAHAFGISPDFDATNYPRRPDRRSLEQFFDDHLIRKPSSDPQPGDVGMFRDLVRPVHCGIFSEVSGSLYLIHATAERRKTIEEPYAHEWPGRLIRAYEFPGVAPWPS